MNNDNDSENMSENNNESDTCDNMSDEDYSPGEIIKTHLNLIDTNIKYAIENGKGLTKSYLKNMVKLFNHKEEDDADDGDDDEEEECEDDTESNCSSDMESGSSSDEEENSEDDKIPKYVLEIVRNILEAAMEGDYELTYDFLLDFIDNMKI
jgi:hypothetical protein